MELALSGGKPMVDAVPSPGIYDSPSPTEPSKSAQLIRAHHLVSVSPRRRAPTLMPSSRPDSATARVDRSFTPVCRTSAVLATSPTFPGQDLLHLAVVLEVGSHRVLG